MRPEKKTLTPAPFTFPGNLCFNNSLMAKNQQPPERERKRESIWSVAGGWLPGYLLLSFTLLFIWTAFVAWLAVAYGSYRAFGLLVEAVGIKSSAGVPGAFALSLGIITAADTGGGAIVVTYRYLNNKFVEPLRRQLRQEGMAEGREQGIEEGIEVGIERGIQGGREEGIQAGREQAREEVYALKIRTMAWYTRQQVALAKGEPCDEPPPFSELSNGKEPAGE